VGRRQCGKAETVLIDGKHAMLSASKTRCGSHALVWDYQRRLTDFSEDDDASIADMMMSCLLVCLGSMEGLSDDAPRKAMC